MGRLVLLLGAVDLPVPAVGDGPGLVAFHGQHGLVAGLGGASEGGHDGHIQVAGHGLVGSGGVALVEGELLGAGGEVLAGGGGGGGGHGGVHVLVGEGGGGLGAGLEGGVVVAHAARVVAAAEVAVGQGGGARGALHGGRAGAALLDSGGAGLGHAGGGRLAGRVGGGAARGGQGGGMRHQVPALVGRREVAARRRRRCRRVETGFHVLVDLLQAVVVEEHDGLDPAGMEEHGGCHSPIRIETSGSFLKAPKTEKRDTKSPRLDQG